MCDYDFDEEKEKTDTVGIIILIAVAIFFLWIARNVFTAYEWEIKDYIFESKESIAKFFRVIFCGEK